MNMIGWIVVAFVIFHAAGMLYAFRDFRQSRAKARREDPGSALAYAMEDGVDHAIYFVMILLWEFCLIPMIIMEGRQEVNATKR